MEQKIKGNFRAILSEEGVNKRNLYKFLRILQYRDIKINQISNTVIDFTASLTFQFDPENTILTLRYYLEQDIQNNLWPLQELKIKKGNNGNKEDEKIQKDIVQIII